MIIVLGCLRSGTLFTTKLLRAITGLKIGHDQLDVDGGVSGFFAGAPDAMKHATLVLHQVRHPLKVIRSMEAILDNTWLWICEQIPEDCNMAQPLIERAARYWVRWNRRCAQLAACTYQVESLTPIAEAIGVRTTWNTRVSDYTNPELTWTDIPESVREEVRSAAEAYGYREDSSADHRP